MIFLRISLLIALPFLVHRLNAQYGGDIISIGSAEGEAYRFDSIGDMSGNIDYSINYDRLVLYSDTLTRMGSALSRLKVREALIGTYLLKHISTNELPSNLMVLELECSELNSFEFEDSLAMERMNILDGTMEILDCKHSSFTTLQVESPSLKSIRNVTTNFLFVGSRVNPDMNLKIDLINCKVDTLSCRKGAKVQIQQEGFEELKELSIHPDDADYYFKLLRKLGRRSKNKIVIGLRSSEEKAPDPLVIEKLKTLPCVEKVVLVPSWY